MSERGAYELADGTLVRTQGQVPKGQPIKKVGIPIGHQDLIDYINGIIHRERETLGGPTAASQPTVESAPESAPSVDRPPPQPPAPVPPSSDTPRRTLEEVIAEMPAAKLAPLVESTVSRLGELGEAGFEALEGHQELQGVGGSFSRGVHILSVAAMGQHQLARILRKMKSKS